MKGWLTALIIIAIAAGFVYFNPEVKNLVSGMFSKINPAANVTKLIPSQMDDYGYYKNYYRSCASLETFAQANGITDVEEKSCRDACGKRNMDYNSFTCEKDLFVCYCQ